MVTLRIVLACAAAGVLLGVGIVWAALMFGTDTIVSI